MLPVSLCLGSLGFYVKDSQIWGSVRAYAIRAIALTLPQIWPFLTQIPKEPFILY